MVHSTPAAEATRTKGAPVSGRVVVVRMTDFDTERAAQHRDTQSDRSAIEQGALQQVQFEVDVTDANPLLAADYIIAVQDGIIYAVGDLDGIVRNQFNNRWNLNLRRSAYPFADEPLVGQPDPLATLEGNLVTGTLVEGVLAAESVPLPLVAFTDWLAFGERGLSSDSIASHLTGTKIGRYSDRDHPRDMADFRRCERLLRTVPSARSAFGAMAQVSPIWALLVEHWAEIVTLADAEAPGWTNAGNRGFKVPTAGARLRDLVYGPLV